MQQQLAKTLADLQLALCPSGQEKMLAYLDLLARWNKIYNLTAIRDPLEAMQKHVADSLAIAPILAKHYSAGTRFLDVGSGAGLPGIPLSLVFSDWQWTLLDSNGKKTRFLVQAKALLGLDNITVIKNRVEMYNPADCFDGVIARAWTDLPNMLEKTAHLYCPTGRLWAMKGIYPAEELAQLTIPYEVHAIQVPNLAEQRHLICLLPLQAQVG